MDWSEQPQQLTRAVFVASRTPLTSLLTTGGGQLLEALPTTQTRH